MSSKINNQPHVILFIISCLFSHTISDPRISEAGLYCGKDKAPQKSNFIPSFIKEMENLSQLVTDHNWGTQSVNISGSVPIFGFAQCFQDLSHTDCLLCYAASRTMLPRCLPSLSARIYPDGCFLRYDNYCFYSEKTDPLRDKVICTSSERLEVQMERSVERVIDVVAKDAGDGGGGFAVGEVEGVYALAQCWKTLGIDGCRDCLSNAVKKSHFHTWTSGYMAPEYLIRGQLTDKADVYSFGVLVLEIVCGGRNNVIREDSGSLLQNVWKHYRSNTLVETIDSSLGDDIPEAEPSRVLHIGLLCTQASASLGPSMTQVVKMLSNSDLDVPTPNQPPFLSSAILDSESSIRSYSTNSFVSNALKKIGVSYSYSESTCSRNSDEPSRSEEPTIQA